jgi:hypothetical protein
MRTNIKYASFAAKVAGLGSEDKEEQFYTHVSGTLLQSRLKKFTVAKSIPDAIRVYAEILQEQDAN